MSRDSPRQASRSTGTAHRSVADSGIHLNLFPAHFSTTSVELDVGLWKDGAAADRLREERPGLHTWRDPQDGTRLYAWFSSGEPTLVPGFRRVGVDIREAPMLFRRMLEDAVAARFDELGFDRKGNGHANYAKGSLLGKIPALAATTSEPIGVYAKVIPRTRYTWSTDGALVVGLVLDVLYTTRLEVPVSEWVAAGLQGEVVGSYVVVLPGSREANDHPSLVGRTVGRISRIYGESAQLTDLREPSLGEIRLSSCAPEPTRVNLGTYLSARYARAWEDGKDELRKTIDRLVRPRRRHELACAAAERLMADSPSGLHVYADLRASLGGMLNVGGSEFPVTRLQEPTYSFDPASDRRTSRRVDTGLREHGPYDRTQVGPRRARILVVALEENRREVEAAVQKLANGVPTREGVFTGLKPMYRLQELELVYAFAPKRAAAPMTRYADAATEALRSAPQRSSGQSRFDLVLVVILDQYRDLRDSENPYWSFRNLCGVGRSRPIGEAIRA